ncbi:MAG: hypothetical protein RSB20_04520, partial [Clostridia bacterium]
MSMPQIVPSGTSKCQAITDIIASVALEQAGLSHILNAEGEKLQKGIALPNVTNDELLLLNSSVKDTVNAISRLEMLLQMKLELFNDCLC